MPEGRPARSVFSAACEAASSPVPTSGMSTWATVWSAFTVVVIGRFMTPVASARARRSASAAFASGVLTSEAFTTTSAGAGEPGNACWIVE